MSTDRAPARQTCRYHCTSCDQHFTSLTAFDAHRDGPWEERICLMPDEAMSVRGRLLLGVQTRDGWCSLQTGRLVPHAELVEAL